MKKIILCVLMSALALFALAGCGSNKMSDEEIHQKLIGAWIPVEDPEETRDGEGNLLSFSVYEFTETQTKCYIVRDGYLETYDMNSYKIQDGDFRATLDDGKVQFAGLEFTDDGHMMWVTNSGKMEYRPATKFEILQYGVPVQNIPEDNSLEEYLSSSRAAEQSAGESN